MYGMQIIINTSLCLYQVFVYIRFCLSISIQSQFELIREILFATPKIPLKFEFNKLLLRFIQQIILTFFIAYYILGSNRHLVFCFWILWTLILVFNLLLWTCQHIRLTSNFFSTIKLVCTFSSAWYQRNQLHEDLIKVAVGILNYCSEKCIPCARLRAVNT